MTVEELDIMDPGVDEDDNAFGAGSARELSIADPGDGEEGSGV
jgi:hypothetical protein